MAPSVREESLNKGPPRRRVVKSGREAEKGKGRGLRMNLNPESLHSRSGCHAVFCHVCVCETEVKERRGGGWM